MTKATLTVDAWLARCLKALKSHAMIPVSKLHRAFPDSPYVITEAIQQGSVDLFLHGIDPFKAHVGSVEVPMDKHPLRKVARALEGRRTMDGKVLETTISQEFLLDLVATGKLTPPPVEPPFFRLSTAKKDQALAKIEDGHLKRKSPKQERGFQDKIQREAGLASPWTPKR